MKLYRILKTFEADESGAVTVDWVVLTAAVCGLGIAALTLVRSGTGTLSSKINTQLSGQSIVTTF